jgi:hypothetical protein
MLSEYEESEYLFNLREATSEVSDGERKLSSLLRANWKSAEAELYMEIICRLTIVNEYPQIVVTGMVFRE